MRTTIIGLMLFGLAVPAAARPPEEDDVQLLKDAAAVLTELHATPDGDIPRALWLKAKCVIVVPGLTRVAFGIGGEFGEGVASCRTPDGGWTAPAFMEIAKGSWGLQIGAASVDLVLLVMNERGMDKLLSNRVVLGAEATVAAGPVGRNVEAGTDAQLNAEILAYSRSRGLFAGVNMSGGVLRPDNDDNAKFYDQSISARDILFGAKATAPPEAEPFLAALRLHDAAAAIDKTEGTTGR